MEAVNEIRVCHNCYEEAEKGDVVVGVLQLIPGALMTYAYDVTARVMQRRPRCCKRWVTMLQACLPVRHYLAEDLPKGD